MSKTISILNDNGNNTGTVTALNLAVSLGLFEKKTLLIDDSVDIEKFKSSLEIETAEKGIVSTTLDYLYYLNIPYHEPDRFNGNFFENVDDSFEYIVIKSPDSENYLYKTVLTATDWIVLPFTPAAETVKSLFAQVSDLKENRADINLCYKIAGILITDFSEDTEFDFDIFNQESIFFDAKIPEFDNIERKTFFSDIKSEHSESFFDFAIEMIDRIST